MMTGSKQGDKSNDFKHGTDPPSDAHQPTVYQIRIKGHLDSQWTDWFDGMAITPQANGDTLLTGPVIDQAALYGLLRKVRDIGTTLLSVICVSPGLADESKNVRWQIESS